MRDNDIFGTIWTGDKFELFAEDDFAPPRDKVEMIVIEGQNNDGIDPIRRNICPVGDATMVRSWGVAYGWSSLVIMLQDLAKLLNGKPKGVQENSLESDGFTVTEVRFYWEWEPPAGWEEVLDAHGGKL